VHQRLNQARPLNDAELGELEAIVAIGPLRDDVSVVLEYYRLTERIAQRVLRDMRSGTTHQE
jgi:hypothetical protein